MEYYSATKSEEGLKRHAMPSRSLEHTYVNSRKPVTADHILYHFIYMKCLE